MFTPDMARLTLVCCCFLTLTKTAIAASTTSPSPTPSLTPAQWDSTSTTRTPAIRSSDETPRSPTMSLNLTSPPLPLTTKSIMANTSLVSTSLSSSELSSLPLNTSQAVSKSSTGTTHRLKTVVTTVSDKNVTSTSYQSPTSGLSTSVRIVIGVVIALVVLVTVLVGGWWVCRRNAAISRDSVKQNQPSIELSPEGMYKRPSIEQSPQGVYKPSRDSLAREVTPNYLHLIHDVQSPKSPTDKSLYQNKRRLYLYDDIDISDTRKSAGFKNMVASKNGDIEAGSSQ